MGSTFVKKINNYSATFYIFRIIIIFIDNILLRVTWNKNVFIIKKGDELIYYKTVSYIVYSKGEGCIIEILSKKVRK